MVSIQQKMKAIDEAPLIQIINKMQAILTTSAGRDKLCRIVQYFLMAMLPSIKAKGRDELYIRLNKFKTQMSLTRKLLRFGKELPLITNIHNNIAQNKQSPVRMLVWKILNDLALALYFFTDHPLYLHATTFWRYSPGFIEKCDYVNNIFWLLNCLLDIVVSIEEILHQKKQLKKITTSDDPQAKQ